MSETKIHIAGMTCGHCVAAVSKALRAVPGVQDVSVNLERAEGIVKGSVVVEKLISAVESEGYEARVIS